MSSDWVAPIATAIVGLAGITATWLTARSSRRDQQALHERQHREAKEAALRDARRNAFAALSGTLTNIIWYSTARIPEIDQSDELRGELSRSLAEVQIMGGEAVRQLAAQTSAAALRFLAGVMEGCEQDSKDELSSQAWGYLNLLQRTMASDLGIAPGSSLEDMKRFARVARYVNLVHKSSRNNIDNEKATGPGHSASGEAKHDGSTSA
jgi:hypothetical protein